MDIGGVVDEDFGGVEGDEGCGGIELEGSVDGGSAFGRDGVDDEPLGARMKSAANAIQPVYAKLTIVLMSVRSYLYTTPHTTRKSAQLDSVDGYIGQWKGGL